MFCPRSLKEAAGKPKTGLLSDQNAGEMARWPSWQRGSRKPDARWGMRLSVGDTLGDKTRGRRFQAVQGSHLAAYADTTCGLPRQERPCRISTHIMRPAWCHGLIFWSYPVYFWCHRWYEDCRCEYSADGKSRDAPSSPRLHGSDWQVPKQSDVQFASWRQVRGTSASRTVAYPFPLGFPRVTPA